MESKGDDPQEPVNRRKDSHKTWSNQLPEELNLLTQNVRKASFYGHWSPLI